MRGVDFPVLAVPDKGMPVLMQPGMDYRFPGASTIREFPARELPIAQAGGVLSGNLPAIDYMGAGYGESDEHDLLAKHLSTLSESQQEEFIYKYDRLPANHKELAINAMRSKYMDKLPKQFGQTGLPMPDFFKEGFVHTGTQVNFPTGKNTIDIKKNPQFQATSGSKAPATVGAAPAKKRLPAESSKGAPKSVPIMPATTQTTSYAPTMAQPVMVQKRVVRPSVSGVHDSTRLVSALTGYDLPGVNDGLDNSKTYVAVRSREIQAPPSWSLPQLPSDATRVEPQLIRPTAITKAMRLTTIRK